MKTATQLCKGGRSRVAAASLAMGFVLAMCQAVHAQTTIFSDDFSGGGGALNGTTPDVTTAGEVWETGDTWLDDGTAGTTVDIVGANGQAAHLDFVPLNGAIYTAEATVLNNQTNWIGFGFLADDPPGGDWTVTSFDVRHSNAPGYAWALTRNNSGGTDQEGFLGANAGGGQPWNGDVVDPTAPVDFRIVLDTTGANWSVEWFLNNVSQGSDSYGVSGNPGIGGIGFSHDRSDTANAGGVISDFSLTELLVFTPTSWAVDGSEDWNDAGNWDNGVPGANGAAALGAVLTAANAPATVNLDVAASLSLLSFNNANQYILSGANTLTMASNAEIEAAAGDHEVAVVIDGVSGLTVAGAGSVTLSATNTFSGTVSLEGGNAVVTSDDNLGNAANDLDFTAGGELTIEGTSLTTISRDVNMTGAGTITVADETVDLTVSGALTGTGALTAAAGNSISLTNASAFAGSIVLPSGTMFVTSSTGLGTSDGTAATGITITGNASTSTLDLSGDITLGDVVTLQAREGAAIDEVHLTSDGNNTLSDNVKGEVGGTNYNMESTAGTLTIGGIISAPDADGVDPRNFVFSGDGNFNITGSLVDYLTDVNGDPVDANPVDGIPDNPENNVNVIKRGDGVLTISTGGSSVPADAEDFWRGTTVIEDGTLAVDDPMTANAGELWSSTIQVMDGAFFDISNFTSTYSLQVLEDPDTIPFNGDEIGQTITGAGTITTGSVTLAAFEDAVFTPGDSIGTLTIDGNLSINQTVANDNGALNYEFSDVTTAGAGANDLIAVTGTLDLDADGAAGGTHFNLNITVTEANLAAGTYTLMTAGTTAGSSATSADFDLVLLNEQGTVLNTRQDDTSVVSINANDVTITFSAAESHNWTGASDGNWDIGGTTNWSSSDNLYFDLDTVNFVDGTGQTTVTIDVDVNDAPVTPGGMTFNNVNDTFTFEGDGIQGNGDVTLNAGANVILANGGSNLTGDVSIAATANLQHGDGVSTGSNTLAGVISGDGTLTVESGILTLTNDNTYTTVTTVNGGTLVANTATALGTTGAGTEVNTGGTVRINGATFTTNEPFTLDGGSLAVGGGAPSAVTFAGAITIEAGGGTIQVDGNTGADGATFDGNIGGSNGGALNANIDGGSTATVNSSIAHDGDLNKTGGGVLALGATGSIAASVPNINVTAGTLDLSAPGPFTVANGQTLNNNSNNTVVGDVIAASGSTVAGAGTYANNVTAQSGSTVRVGGDGMPQVEVPFVVDDYNDTSLAEYGFAKILDQGTVTNTSFASPAGLITSTSTGADGAEQVMFFRSDNTLAAGEELLIDVDLTQANGNDLGIFVGATPADLGNGVSGDNRATHDYVFVSFRSATQLNHRGFIDGAEIAQIQEFGVNATQLFIARTATDAVELGWYDNGVRNLIDDGVLQAVYTGLTDLTIFDNIGFYSDLRADGVGYNGLDNLAIDGANNPIETVSETMTVLGDLTMQAGSSLAIDIYDPDTLDLLAVTGTFTAAGTLDVTLDGGATTPQLGDAFDILDFGAAAGSFNTLNLPDLTGGLNVPVWDVSQLLVTGILSVIRAPGDADFDGDVDLDDYNILSGNMYTNVAGGYDDGDFDEDGDVDFEDFVVQALNFGDWPSADETIGDLVPEPASMVLMLMGAGLLMRRKSR